MNRIIGISLLTILNIITTLATLGLLILLLLYGDVTLEGLSEKGVGFFVLLLGYLFTEVTKWIVYIFILLKRREKLWYFFHGYGLLIAFIAFFLNFLIPIIIGLLYLIAVYLLKQRKVIAENDYLLFDEEPGNDRVKSIHDLPFIIGLTLLVIVSFYMTWTSLEATMTVVSYNLKLGIVPLLHLVLNLLLSILCWVSLYNVINNRLSNWKYFFGVLFIVDVTILIWRTIALSKLAYFTSVFMLLDPVRIFMLAFTVIGFLLLIRKRNKEEVGL